MAKEFNKKFMHPTRRKLVNMVLTGGDYEKNTVVGYTADKVDRQVGDVWEDEFHRYEKNEGFTLKTSKNSEAFDELRKWRDEQSQCKGANCKTFKITEKHKKLIKKTGYCINCLAELEDKIRLSGFWEQYEDYKIYTRMLIEGKIKLEELEQAYSDVKPYYEYINEDGTSDKWELPKPVEEVKAEIKEMIDYGTEEIKKVEEFRNKAFEILKQNNLEHYVS
jgi:hypothetical protein